jgi:hypothetical protein
MIPRRRRPRKKGRNLKKLQADARIPDGGSIDNLPPNLFLNADQPAHQSVVKSQSPNQRETRNPGAPRKRKAHELPR